MRVITVLLLIISTQDAYSESSRTWGMTTGLTSTKAVGGKLGFFVNTRHEDWLLRWSFLEANLYGEDPEGYRLERLSNDNTVCRDETNGQFTDKSNCTAMIIDMTTSLDASKRIGSDSKILIGGGVQLLTDAEYGESVIPYLASSYDITSEIEVKGRIGLDYLQVYLGFYFY
jgi:hypothetical protein